LQQARKLAPESPEIANNLAWVLAHRNPPDFPRAIELIDAAIEAHPDSLVLRDTRGRILAKSGRWKEALDELVPCMPVMKDKADYHDVLAEVYEHLGFSDRAEEHQQWAQRLKAGRAPRSSPSSGSSADPAPR
jgi:predicted Zn-dependent protease